MSAGPDGQWVVIANNGTEVTSSSGISLFLLDKIETFVDAGKIIDCLVFAPNGSWVLIGDDWRWYSRSVPNVSPIQSKVSEYITQRGGVRDLVFSASGNGWFILGKDNAFYSQKMGEPYHAAVDAKGSGRQIRELEVAADGRVVKKLILIEISTS